MYYSVGVDPGTGDGAIVLLVEGALGVDVLKVWDMPTRIKSSTRKRNRRGQMQTYNKKEVDPIAFNSILSEIMTIVAHPENITLACIESVHAMPASRKGKDGEEKKQGIASTAQFMDSFGVARALLECWFPSTFTKVAPQTWKKMFELSGKDKDTARQLAIKYWGEPLFKRKKDVGRADAALIAYYPILKRLKEKQ